MSCLAFIRLRFRIGYLEILHLILIFLVINTPNQQFLNAWRDFGLFSLGKRVSVSCSIARNKMLEACIQKAVLGYHPGGGGGGGGVTHTQVG